MKFSIISLCALVSLTKALKLMVIGDLYIDPNVSDSCHFGYCLKHGVYGKPSPVPLLYEVFDDAKLVFEREYNISINKYIKKVEREAKKNNVTYEVQEFNGNYKDPEFIDAILITGNFLHPEFMKGSDDLERKIASISEFAANTTKLLSERFPGVPILPVIGHTDNPLGFQALDQPKEVKEEVQRQLFESFFLTSQMAPAQKEQIRQTFMVGGYYLYNISDEFSIIGLNSMYLQAKNNQFLGPGKTASNQLVWLQNTLKANDQLPSHEKKTFLILMNVLPGVWNINNTLGNFWHQNFTKQYFDIMKTYEDSVVMSIGKLYARLDLKAPISQNTQNLNHIIYQAPPLSPLNNSNPAYSILELNSANTSYHLSEIRTRHLQLYSKIMYKADKWVETALSKHFIIEDLGNATQVRDFQVELMSNPFRFAEYESICTNGQSWLVQRANQFLMPFLSMIWNQQKIQGYLCTGQFIESDHPALKRCLENSFV